MDLQLPKGALELFASIALALNTSLTSAPPPPQETNLAYPALISSYNLPSEVIVSNKDNDIIQNLNEATVDEDLSLKTVIKKEEPLKVVELVTVDLPIVYTVKEPDSSDDSEIAEKDQKKELKIEIIEEAKADEVPSPSPSTSTSASPTPTPTPTATPAPVIAGNAGSEQLFQMVNDHRAKLGLPVFEKDERLCKMARERAPQIKGELSAGTLHKGFKAYNLPYWATENIAAYSTIEENLKFWLSDYIHKKAIESDHKYSCVACIGTSCSQIFTSFVPK